MRRILWVIETEEDGKWRPTKWVRGTRREARAQLRQIRRLWDVGSIRNNRRIRCYTPQEDE